MCTQPKTKNGSVLKGFSLAHLNARSLLKHKDEIEFALGGYDVIGITETWLTERVDDRLIGFTQRPYSVLRQDRVTLLPSGRIKKGGGIVIYIKSDLAPYVQRLSDRCKCTSDSEELWLTLCKPGWKKIILAIIYRPPNGNINNFINKLNDTLQCLLGKGNPNGKELYILGDLNIDYSTQNSDPSRSKLKDLEYKYNLRQLIKRPTRETLSSKSVIDLLFTTLSPDLVMHSGTLEVAISDHVPIFLSRKKKREHHTYKYKNVRSSLSYDKNTLKLLLLDDPRWEQFWKSSLDPNQLRALMLSVMKDCLEIIAPIKRIKIRSDQPNWFDGELKCWIREKNVLYKIASTTKKPVDWDKFKNKKSEVRRLLQSKKQNFIIKKLEDNKDCPKKFWKEIQKNLFFGKLKTSVQHIAIKDNSGKLAVGTDAADPLNAYYSEIGPELADKFQAQWSTKTMIRDTSIPVMTFNYVGIKEVMTHIKRLNVNKSFMIENISMPYLKDSLSILAFEFTYIINECLDKGIMPQDWVLGTITPVPKNGFSQSMSDYRPISVLPAPSKIIERIVYNQLVYHLESHGLLYCYQHGFRKDHSTSSAIYELVQFIYNSLDERKSVSSVYIDYSKAFDTIDHGILCKKLEYYGLHKFVINWCLDYISHRKQCVNIEGHISGYKSISYGVPQGSILGPLFFIIYVNDLMTIFKNEETRILLYADDTVLYFAHGDPVIACKTVESALAKVINWCSQNKLTINIKKTKHMLFKASRSTELPIEYTVRMGNCVLENVNSYNYLGVVINICLSFKEFVKLKCKKIDMRLYQLFKMRKYITTNTACTLYKQAIIPLFDYADFLIDSGPKYFVERLDSLHEKAVRLIDCKNNENLDLASLETLYRLNDVRTRRYEHHCTIMYRMSRQRGKLDEYRPPMVLRSRNKVKFKKRNRNKEKILKSPMYRGVTLWDMIPQSIQRSLTKVKFKREIKTVPLGTCGRSCN